MQTDFSRYIYAMKYFICELVVLLVGFSASASYILIPMDADGQKEHLKAYGIAYWTLDKQQSVKCLLNYR